MSQTVLPNTAGAKYHRSAKRRRSERSAGASVETMGQIQAKIPTEVLVTDRRNLNWLKRVLSPLPCVKTLISSLFLCKLGTKTEALSGQRRETNYKLGTQLPYLFIINRLATTSRCCSVNNWGHGKKGAT